MDDTEGYEYGKKKSRDEDAKYLSMKVKPKDKFKEHW